MENIFNKELTNFIPIDESEEGNSAHKFDLIKLYPLTLKFSIILKERMIMREKEPSPSVLKILSVLDKRVQDINDIFVANFETRPRNFTNFISTSMIKTSDESSYFYSIYDDYTLLKHYGGIFVVHESQFDHSYVPKLFEKQRYYRLKKLKEREKCYIMYLSVLRPSFAKNNRLNLQI